MIQSEFWHIIVLTESSPDVIHSLVLFNQTTHLRYQSVHGSITQGEGQYLLLVEFFIDFVIPGR